jgi:hypothetical protein
MDYSEFVATAKGLVERLRASLPADVCEWLDSYAFGGEWDELVSVLAATLVRDHLPVTSADRDDLYALLADADEPTDVLDNLTIVDTPPQPSHPGHRAAS